MANVNETVQGLLKGMEGFVTTKSVVGEAIRMDDGTVLLPLVDVTFGVAAGAFNKDAKKSGDSKSDTLRDRVAGGLGGKLSPNAILVIKDGNTRLITVKDTDTLTRIVDMAPEVITRVKAMFSKKDKDLNIDDSKVDEAAQELLKSE
ncbi:MAG: GerW family sporulation protein [Lachnospiraceae bacterium]|nr:GerW family sporulation protein [Lachnospiraceae bacterium]